MAKLMTHRLALSVVLCVSATCPLPVLAQNSPPPVRAAASAPGVAASITAAQRVEITGGRGSDEEQRCRSTAAKIVIGRDEIERIGDSNTLEILKCLPGVTVPGAPGRGGNPRVRGMGGGFTQIRSPAASRWCRPTTRPTPSWCRRAGRAGWCAGRPLPRRA